LLASSHLWSRRTKFVPIIFVFIDYVCIGDLSHLFCDDINRELSYKFKSLHIVFDPSKISTIDEAAFLSVFPSRSMVMWDKLHLHLFCKKVQELHNTTRGFNIISLILIIAKNKTRYKTRFQDNPLWIIHIYTNCTL